MKVVEWVLMVLTLGVLMYPLSTQALMAVLVTVIYPFAAVSTEVTLSNFIDYLTAFGGSLGYVGLVMSVFCIKNKITLFFLISGLLAYSYFIYGDYSHRGSTLVWLWFRVPLLVAIGYSFLIVINLAKKSSDEMA